MIRLVLVAVLLLGGCSAYVKPGVSQDDAQVDYQSCSRQHGHMETVPVFTPSSQVFIPVWSSDSAAVDACMRAKGYQRERGAGPAPDPRR